MKFLLFSAFLMLTYTPDFQDFTGQQLLEKSIQYHDKTGKWDKAKSKLILYEEGLGTKKGTSCAIELNNKDGIFRHTQIYDSNHVERSVSASNQCAFKLNGISTVSDEDFEKYRLNCERSKLFRNYYSYLWGLPMKLKDRGTVIHKEVKQEYFQGKLCYVLKVTYDKSIGDDTWYFYMDTNDFSLVGYCFYHDEQKRDGEYIILEGELNVNGVIIPKKRTWYVNKDDSYLGTDILLKGEKMKKKEIITP